MKPDYGDTFVLAVLRADLDMAGMRRMGGNLNQRSIKPVGAIALE
jgi:hypothetical protein